MIKFADEAYIIVSSGNGGDGCVAFRREKYVPMGGPAGGDGGRGGDVVFEVRRNLRTLAHLRYQQTFKAQNGIPGMGKGMYGKDGEDIVIPVPPGTLIKDAETGQVLHDFADEAGVAGAGRLGGAKGAARGSGKHQVEGRMILLKGGNGGWGNIHFKSSVNQAPKTAQPGKPGRTMRLKIELQLIADIGFVGFPNAGKSSLLDYFTNARPKIAPYPFTTKIPNLGMLTVGERDIVLADIPGIIEGAHEGAGLGIRFLKHIARTAALAFLVDLSDENWREAFPVLLEELRSYAPELAEKKRLLVATKLDLPEAEERLAEFRAAFPEERLFAISVYAKSGLEELKAAFTELVLEKEREDEESQRRSASIFDIAPEGGGAEGPDADASLFAPFDEGDAPR